VPPDAIISSMTPIRVTLKTKMRLNLHDNTLCPHRILILLALRRHNRHIHPSCRGGRCRKTAVLRSADIHHPISRATAAVNDYWQNAAVPAYNRMGIQPSGFSPSCRIPRQPHLCAHPVRLTGRLRRHPATLAADADYQKAAAEFLNGAEIKSCLCSF